MHDAIHWREEGARLRRQGRLAEAVAACRRSLEIAPDDAKGWNELAHALRFQGQLADAREAAERALKTDPELAAAWFNLGAVQVAQGDAARGTEAYRKALELKPQFAEAWSNLGIALGELGRREEEIDAYRRALEINPQLAPVWRNLGVALREHGKTGDALAGFDRALVLEPDDIDVLVRRGDALQDLGRHDEALASYERALALAADNAYLLYNRGVSLQNLGRHEQALASYDKFIAIRPEDADALNNRGNVLQALGRREEALASYDRALAIKPEYAEAHYNRGNILHASKRYSEAVACFDRALEIRPDYVQALNNRGTSLQGLDRHNAAMASYDRALALDPARADIFYNRGASLQALNRFEEALASYERALAIDPRHIEALNNRGNALQDLDRHAEAIASYERALAAKADYAEAHHNRGNALRTLNRNEEAFASFRNALAIKPDYADALYNAGLSLQAMGRNDEAIGDYERALAAKPDHRYALGALFHLKQRNCDWSDLQNMKSIISEHIADRKSIIPPFGLLGASPDPAEQLLCARQYAADVTKKIELLPWRGPRPAHPKIRIAYLSADFKEHPVAYLTAGLFEHHDRSAFEVSGLSFGPPDSSTMRARLQQAFERFIDVGGQSDPEVVRWLRDNEIDIAIDLMGHTGNARPCIFARRPAPIQVNYLGHPGTMGASFIDYIIGDEFVIPPAQRSHYSEKIAYLPDTFQANDSKRSIADYTPTRGEAGLPQHGFVFCCFSNNYKITPEIFDVWMRLLRDVDGSVLWLIHGNPTVERNLRNEATIRGIASDRLVFAPHLPYAEYLARYRCADLFLDTLPFNAGTTASDALWASLPVLTCAGEAFAARMAGGLLNAIGLPELITHSLEDYEALALKLATTPDALADIKARLARNRTTYPLFDTARFCRHLESAYKTMWEIQQRGEPPRNITVPRILGNAAINTNKAG